MYTDPVIISNQDLSKRAYVKVYINSIRYRFYNGNDLNISCHPNRCNSIKDRERALKTLSFTLARKLDSGWMPGKRQTLKMTSAIAILSETLKEIPTNGLSKVYQRDQVQVCTRFLTFVKQTQEPTITLESITPPHIETFLQQFKGSNTYYMNKRRTLSSIFSQYLALGLILRNPVQMTRRKKETSTLNKAYTKEQLNRILGLINSRFPNLYLCSLIMYGCFLRPHREIRLLTGAQFDEDLQRITLAGSANKGKKVRVVSIPDFVRRELVRINFKNRPEEQNIFTGRTEPLNECYFSLQWSRIKPLLIKEVGITNDHTLYSIRATAAIDVYRKTKDPYKLQMLMGHSSLQVTLTYLRSLGVYYQDQVDDLPTL